MVDNNHYSHIYILYRYIWWSFYPSTMNIIIRIFYCVAVNAWCGAVASHFANEMHGSAQRISKEPLFFVATTSNRSFVCLLIYMCVYVHFAVSILIPCFFSFGRSSVVIASNLDMKSCSVKVTEMKMKIHKLMHVYT